MFYGCTYAHPLSLYLCTYVDVAEEVLERCATVVDRERKSGGSVLMDYSFIHQPSKKLSTEVASSKMSEEEESESTFVDEDDNDHEE